MEPPAAKTCLLPHTAYRTTKEPAIALRICFDHIAGDDDLYRLSEGKPLVEHVLVAVFLIHLEIADYHALAYF